MTVQFSPSSKQRVRSLFDGIARRYDFLNHLLSGGLDYYWRRCAIEHLTGLHPLRILDVATGTADFALATLRLGPETVVGVDIAENMLIEGRRKIAARGVEARIRLQTGEAENITFPDNTFDAAIVAFGARNFENIEAGLSEMRRVTRPGGMVVVLEFSHPRTFPFRQLYFWYFRNILPLIGRLVSRHGDAYGYLPDTVMRFPEGEAFLALMSGAGMRQVEQERLTLGIATVYTGVK
jgi:demethylmenaquinone methyltransferase / 2-methoxy-6-polyprenyl-1,4-benzoquinol methylase